MGKAKKTYDKIIKSGKTTNIRFNDMRTLLRNLRFDEYIEGGHHIFIKSDVPERINLQSVKGQCKPYQVKQVRKLIFKYNLGLEE